MPRECLESAMIGAALESVAKATAARVGARVARRARRQAGKAGPGRPTHPQRHGRSPNRDDNVLRHGSESPPGGLDEARRRPAGVLSGSPRAPQGAWTKPSPPAAGVQGRVRAPHGHGRSLSHGARHSGERSQSSLQGHGRSKPRARNFLHGHGV